MANRMPQHLNTEDIAERIAHRTAFSAADVIGVLYALADAIATEAREGNIINLQPLGRFATSKRKEIVLTYTPGQRIKTKLI